MSLWGKDKIFFIVEIGANHNGDLELCKQMIVKAKECGADAVKLQKRNNDKLFMKSILDAPYNSEYAQETGTYREHREYLDRFGDKEFRELKQLADDIGIIFFATPFDFDSVDFLESIGVELYKIASCDLKNIPLIKYIASKGKPIVMSTGGGTKQEIFNALESIPSQQLRDVAVLHCVSTYPNKDEQLNLGFIKNMFVDFYGMNDVMEYHKNYEFLVEKGFSSHHSGILPFFIAYMCGARVFEAHFTFNRGMSGSDHGFSLEPQALRKVCYDLKRIPVMLGDGEKKVLPEEQKGFVWKFGKAIHPVKRIKEGQVLTTENIAIKAPADGLPPSRYNDIIGKVAICDISTGDVLTEDMIE